MKFGVKQVIEKYGTNSLFDCLDGYLFYDKAPLPFLGQKRLFARQFTKIIKSLCLKQDVIFVDLFGGSGLLSNNVKVAYQNNKVIWNDFDNYQNRLNNIELTNKILNDVKQSIGKYKKDEKISNDDREKIGNILSKYIKEYGEDKIDFITLSSNLRFSGNYCHNLDDLMKGCFYYGIIVNEYISINYLKGVVRVSKDFKLLLNDYENENAFYIIDPPYLNTFTEAYSNSNSSSDLFYLIDRIKNKPFIFFEHNLSLIENLFKEHNIKYRVYKRKMLIRYANKTIIKKGHVNGVDMGDNNEYMFLCNID